MVLSMTRRTWLLVQSGCLDQIRAALAEATAVASLVPSVLQKPVVLVQAATMSSPGADMST
jgi:hypothetical protein